MTDTERIEQLRSRLKSLHFAFTTDAEDDATEVVLELIAEAEWLIAKVEAQRKKILQNNRAIDQTRRAARQRYWDESDYLPYPDEEDRR